MIDDRCNAVLTDFGISRMLDTRGFTTKSIAGSCRWMSKELLCDEDQVPSFASDVWSLGMTILEVWGYCLSQCLSRSEADFVDWRRFLPENHHLMIFERTPSYSYL